MAVWLTNLSWWVWSGKHETATATGELRDTVKFPVVRKGKKVKRKWESREERKKVDTEYDVVLVPSDGVCVSGSESEDSDWSVGWLEPHAPGFHSDSDADVDNTFAVLVPCYAQPSNDAAGSHGNMEEWLSFL